MSVRGWSRGQVVPTQLVADEDRCEGLLLQVEVLQEVLGETVKCRDELPLRAISGGAGEGLAGGTDFVEERGDLLVIALQTVDQLPERGCVPAYGREQHGVLQPVVVMDQSAVLQA